MEKTFGKKMRKRNYDLNLIKAAQNTRKDVKLSISKTISNTSFTEVEQSERLSE